VIALLEATVDETSSYDGITLRLLFWEQSAIEGACAALNGLERSILMQEAALAETDRLGIRWTTRPPPPLAEPWPYKPVRETTSSDVRVNVSISITLAELVTRAAEYVDVSRPHFIIGSTLAHIGRLQRCFQALCLPESAHKRILTDLRRIKLPPHYQYPPRRRT
jgi:uncharacterized protein (DUF1778 family)